MHPQRPPEEKAEGSRVRREGARGETKEPKGATEKKMHKEGTEKLSRTETKYHRHNPNQIPLRANGERVRQMANREYVLAQKQEERSERRLHQKRKKKKKKASETAQSTRNQHAIARETRKKRDSQGRPQREQGDKGLQGGPLRQQGP